MDIHKEQIFCIYQGKQCVAIMTTNIEKPAHFTFASGISYDMSQEIMDILKEVPDTSPDKVHLIRNAYLEKGFTVMNVDDVKQ